MKLKITFTSTFTLLVLLCFSCRKGAQNDVPNDIVYDSITVSKVHHLDNDSTKPLCSLEVKYVFPVKYADSLILAKMQKDLNFAFLDEAKYEQMKPRVAVDKYLDYCIECFETEAKEQAQLWQESGELYHSCYRTIKNSILFDKGGIVLYQVSAMDFKGRGDSCTIYRNLIFDLHSGESIEEEDIFISNYKKILDPLLKEKLLLQNKAAKASDLEDFGYWGIEDMTSNNNFTIGDTGITYIFNPGEYSATSIGEIRIFILYDEIAAILKESSPISFLIKK